MPGLCRIVLRAVLAARPELAAEHQQREARR